MSKNNDEQAVDIISFSVPAFGYELIREELMDDLLGNDKPGILYWAGKRIARKYPLFSIEEITEFFSNAGWGNLTLEYEKKYEMGFSLTSELIKNRLSAKTSATFQLEAGFLAEQIKRIKKVYAETFEHPKKKVGTVRFIVRWDEETD